jgi:glutamate synthase (NADPH/NADH) small chain
VQGLFAEAHPPLTPAQATIEADRCLFCYDAPCVEACPTAIDVPRFIRGIATGNLAGAATTILDANILGGSCARVCPTEVLCEAACVRTAQEGRAVPIGLLQRHAVDHLYAAGVQPYRAAAPSGRRVAVVGAGPAGLACAHALAREGHAVTIHEARPKPGGLNEYGIAAYKLVDDYAQREVDFVLGVGGIDLVHGSALGRDVTLEGLRRTHDAVFLAMGQSGVRALGVDGATLDGVEPAVDFIARLRQDAASARVGRRVVVVGGGNTAVDAAVQSRKLGAEEVTIVYRGAPEAMSATVKEQDWARRNGVAIRHRAAPRRLHGEAGRVVAVEFAQAGADEALTLAADKVLLAVGQVFVPDPVSGGAAVPEISGGRIAVDAEGRTSLPGVWAGGDCVAGPDLTVQAVADGKRAAASIHAALTAGRG